MKYKLVNSIIRENFAEKLLKERKVENFNIFVNPTGACLFDPLKLKNIDKGANLLINILNNPKSNIVFIVDCDVDGYTSSAILWLYIKDIYPEANLSYKIHSGKQHGLEDMMEELEEQDRIDLVLLPDAGSNDNVYHDRLKGMGIPIIVLDHHETDIISESAIIINNQLSEDYLNKSLTGAGVVWQFCRYLDKKLNKNFAEKYIDLAALGIIADMANVLSLENRYIIKKGLTNINNYFFKILIEKQAYSIGGRLTPISIAFYVAPLINALIRVGTEEEKEKLFLSFLNGKEIVDSTKRGEKGLKEELAVQIARTCTNAKNKQNRIKEKVVEVLDGKIAKKDLLNNKILFVRLEDDDIFPPVLNGLVAMQLAARYKHPTIVARLNDEGFVRGSIRGLNDAELKDFKSFLNDSGLFEYCEGHANAAGCSIKNENISKFHEYANRELADTNFNENTYDVNFIFDAKEDLVNLVTELDIIKDTYGQMNSEPLIIVKDIPVFKNKVIIMGTKKDTVKIEYNEICYIFFKAKKFIDFLETIKEPSFNLTVLGKANLNLWEGNATPQISVNDWEIKTISIFDF